MLSACQHPPSSSSPFLSPPLPSSLSLRPPLSPLLPPPSPLQPQSLTATKLFELIKNLREQDRCTTTFGCLDNAQLTQMCKFAETIYVSGWQVGLQVSTTW